ncbi:MAG: hypothetical protein A2360_03905 [Candidatus Staskawiczbacteria bacterium RIFOXYB1_FULL_32_11]|uniref:Uncharacterized protein n=1 Tax=Candidatus Staskawiczbacteria bacterium RIFOXYD1_FULL_32_13 TaxID=1802234 RepID=A0A1G2JKR0_9BACT|nr:MAG: hypothetical protein A2360_03905 [Candidatus Staskawiczbacteria bacterium RIFOXYB1_FULL_32_11]OGZ79157.1 MAG: hypothetical protein A2256_02795 [Candidatus Staskawiczbacteria bacterium RIFOXYA2_FULL_32_7]OGZ87715.1 MAG: hypothetical protein A2561_03425 [Candidatus Staskawiczbacteria bacterium RIFOXYD1_FULL_32_13]
MADLEFTKKNFRALYWLWKNYLSSAKGMATEVVEGAGRLYSVLIFQIHCEDKNSEFDKPISDRARMLWQQFLAYITI